MASKAVVDAVMATLGDSWNGLTVVPMNTAGEASGDGSDFLVVQFPVSNTERPVIDRGHYREEGGIRFVLNMGRGLGMDDILTKSEELAELFREEDLGDGVETGVPGSPFFDNTNDAGGFFQAAFVVPYTYSYEP